jgi:hypothetical protein
MSLPIFPVSYDDIDQSIAGETGSIEHFFKGGASVARSDLFDVFLFGEYVDKALWFMQNIATGLTTGLNFTNWNAASTPDVISHWMNNHVLPPDGDALGADNKNGTGKHKVVALRWAANSVTIPPTKLQASSQKFFMSAVTAEQFNQMEKVGEGNLSMNIIERADFLWSQFFTTLAAQCVNTSTMTAEDNFNKLGAVVLAYRPAPEIDKESNTPIGMQYKVGQAFIYRSLLFGGFPGFNMTRANKGGQVSYSVSFTVSRTIQFPFHALDDQKGLDVISLVESTYKLGMGTVTQEVEEGSDGVFTTIIDGTALKAPGESTKIAYATDYKTPNPLDFQYNEGAFVMHRMQDRNQTFEQIQDMDRLILSENTGYKYGIGKIYKT